MKLLPLPPSIQLVKASLPALQPPPRTPMRADFSSSSYLDCQTLKKYLAVTIFASSDDMSKVQHHWCVSFHILLYCSFNSEMDKFVKENKCFVLYWIAKMRQTKHQLKNYLVYQQPLKCFLYKHLTKIMLMIRIN